MQFASMPKKSQGSSVVNDGPFGLPCGMCAGPSSTKASDIYAVRNRNRCSPH